MGTRTTRYTFTVKGRLPFPLDMLRYDSCWPANGESVEAIEASLKRYPQPEDGYIVNLVSSYSPPEEGRWRSFSWTVSDVRKVAN